MFDSCRCGNADPGAFRCEVQHTGRRVECIGWRCLSCLLLHSIASARESGLAAFREKWGQRTAHARGLA